MGALVILTATSKLEDAQKISSCLVENKLAACVTILSNAESIFFWKGKLAKEKEFLLIIKSRSELFGETQKFLQKIHPYDIPEILALKVEAVNPPYFRWLSEVTKSEGKKI